MKENIIPKGNCLNCGYRMDRTSEIKGDSSPTPGDMSLCLNCGFVSVFDEQLNMRLPTREEDLTIKSDPRIIEAQIARSAIVSKDLRK